MTKYTPQEFEEIARQLRKPAGKDGKDMGNMMNESNRAINLHSIAVLDPQPGDSILEIGMGNGYFVKNIVNLDRTILYCGVDHSPDMIGESSRINAEFIKEGRVKFFHSNETALPLNSGQFNKVLTVNTIYFWDDPVKMLTEIKRVLAPEGLFILSLRPKLILEQYPFTQYGFMMLETHEIEQTLIRSGYGIKGITRVIEPDQEFDGQPEKRESIIIVGQI